MARISVLMGIYNCAETLPLAIQSILDQTVTDWELILCEDGSTDQTYAVARSYQKKFPEKIILLKNEKNCGLNHTLNRCLSAASGEFIARMDGDDTCSPDRFEKELDVLEREENIAIVSSEMTLFDETGVWGSVTHSEYPTEKDFIYGSPICHAPCLVRKEAFDAVDGYSEAKRLLRVEDYHLWLKMYCAGYRAKNIQMPLYQMRDDRNASGRRRFCYRWNETYVRWLAMRKLNIPFWYFPLIFRPILVGLLPKSVYNLAHKRKLKAK